MSSTLGRLSAQPTQTAAAWALANTVLPLGQLGIESDTQKAKIGDGVLGWNALPYLNAGNVVVSPTTPPDPQEGMVWVQVI